jgi:hypothetical protein
VIGGKRIKEKFKYIGSMLGKYIKISNEKIYMIDNPTSCGNSQKA